MENVTFLIPARMGSKGFKFKNRKLFNFTADIIPDEYLSQVYVSTDDDVIKKKAEKSKVNIIDRPAELSQDETSMPDVLTHFIDVKNISDDSDIILLYLTYPERTWKDVVKIYNFFKDSDADSLICADEIKQHPYLCFYEKDNLKAELVVDHNLYRRQDYPKCLKLSMFVSCYKAGVIEKLHPLCMEDNTIFYKLNSHKVDVDVADDFKNLETVNQGI